MTPLFSVVIPCYGHARYVRDAVESVFAQSTKNFEIIAVNDGSPDATGSILDELQRRSPVAMHVEHTENLGAANALNAGARLAAAPFLAFMNDDDRYQPERLEVFERVVYRINDFIWGYTGVSPIDEEGHPIPTAEIPDRGRRVAIEGSTLSIGASKRIHRFNLMVSSGNLVVRSETFRELGGFHELRFVHDWDMAMRLMDVRAPYAIERPLYCYRIHRGSAHEETFRRSGSRLANHEGLGMKSAAGGRRAERYDPMSIRVGVARDLLEGDTDESKAVRAVLWSIDTLRRFPAAYGLVRRSAILARSVRRRVTGARP